jgi:helicase
MTESLNRWMGAADAIRHMVDFHIVQIPLSVAYIRDRVDDYYTSLVGDLFDRMRQNQGESPEWARLGNAFAQFAEDAAGLLTRSAISRSEAALYAATAFYSGGFPASAYLSIRRLQPAAAESTVQACYDLLARPAHPASAVVANLLAAVRQGNNELVAELTIQARQDAAAALATGPDQWIPARLYEQLMRRFAVVNLRAVLPARPNGFWNPLIDSLITRSPSTWEFFPSQIDAIRGNLLEEGPSFALQMPTGAGKTTLCETLLFDHLRRHPLEAAVLLVPYRSLASELRGGVVRRLNGLGISSRCAYGGTVPTGDEVHALDNTQLIVATPEALSGLLSADQQFLRRISLVICDEGHLLGAPSRGIGLELLLARLKGREGGAPRFVFISAIVPNIEEINAWLGGTADSVIRSEYRPALADFALLRERETAAGKVVDLAVHPHLPEPARFTVEGFLSRSDFRFTNPSTGRLKTYPFTSVKTRAVAAARKALPMGAAVIFAANKRGDQGAIGIAEELLDQLASPLTLPNPAAFANAERLYFATDYLQREFGDAWIGTRALAAAAVLHHGDIPQETREVLEDLLRRGHVMFAICTNTLAEGVNLPIRTLVLYSVQRRSGAAIAPLLSRDIKNLVGRAGRAGATTKGLVVCANHTQWPDVARVDLQQPGESLVSALRELLDRLRHVLALRNTPLTNLNLEATPSLHTLIDGIDSTLIDLASEEITQEGLTQLATDLADQTFAAQSAGEASKELLRTVFRLRATSVANLRSTGRLEWIRQTGARMRMINTVEAHLLNAFGDWETLENPLAEQFVNVVLEWAWQHG